MNILIYIAGVQLGCSNGQHLDMAIDYSNQGHNVFVLSCDSSIGGCMNNPGWNPLWCKFCNYQQKKDLKRWLPKNAEHHWIREYAKEVDTSTFPKMEYHTAKELRALTYKGVDIGMAVMSSYISLTRNMNPEINNKSRLFFDGLIYQQILTISILEKLIDKYHFDLIIFQNGRGSQFKPFLNICQQRGINFICTEDTIRNGVIYVDNRYNLSSHDIRGRYQCYNECWDSSPLSIDERKLIAKSFFENRKNAEFSGDKIYIKDQKKGLMPKDWNNNVENIVIFNSSEDEFSSVSKEFDDSAIFPSQLDGIISIVEHYKNDKSKHFTLRIHPNLMNIPYKYHTDLFKLDYPNLTVVSGNSPISTYSLMEAADKIIVFGSTMGYEASYWGKPVICLRASFYRDFDIVYLPKNIEEVWSLIDTKDLKCLFKESALKMAYYIMSENLEKSKFIDLKRYNKHIYKDKYLKCFTYQKILGSNFLYAFVTTFFSKYMAYWWPAKYRNLPRKEA